jgi:CheY-like chemotaxis protein
VASPFDEKFSEPVPPMPVKRCIPTTMTILYVDDEPFMREVISLGLRRSGFEVVTASGGVAALDLLENSVLPISILMTDLSMPGMDGVQLAGRVKGRWPDLPIIAFSGDPYKHLKTPSDSRVFSAVVLKGASGLHLRETLLSAAAGAATSFLDPIDHQVSGLVAAGDHSSGGAVNY